MKLLIGQYVVYIKNINVRRIIFQILYAIDEFNNKTLSTSL